MATVVKIPRKNAVELLLWLKWGTCITWSNARMAEKLAQVKDVLPEDSDPDDESVASTLIDVVAAIEDGVDFEVVGETQQKSEKDEVEVEVEDPDEDDEWEDDEDEPLDLEDDDDLDLEDENDPEEDEPAEVEPKEEVNDGPTEQTEPEVEPEKVAEKEEKPKKGRGRPKGSKGKKEKKKKEPEVEPEPDMHYETYATEEPRFEVHEELTITQAKELLRANVANRPYRKPLAKRYAEDIIRKKWKLTLEPVIFDTTGKMSSGQHRLEGLILAEKQREKNPEHYEETYGWDAEITMPCVLAFGADPEGNDLQDRGQQRSGADVLFRREEFKDVKPAELKKLSTDLYSAARLCWMRLGNQKVSDAPHFPHSEMLDFIEQHPKLKDMVAFVYVEDRAKDKKICTYLKRGTMAGLAYLFGISETNKEATDLDFSNLEKAEDFVSKFAAGTFDNNNDPIYQLRDWLTKELAKPDPVSRDTKILMIIKVWNAYVKGEDLEPKQMKIKKKDDLSIGNLI